LSGQNVIAGNLAAMRIVVPVGSTEVYRAATIWSNVRNRIHSEECGLPNEAFNVSCICQ
jgi:hypothetical protein